MIFANKYNSIAIGCRDNGERFTPYRYRRQERVGGRVQRRHCIEHSVGDIDGSPLGVTVIDCAPPPIAMGAPAAWVRVSTDVMAPAAAVPDTT